MNTNSRPLSATPSLRRLTFGHFSERDEKNSVLRRKILERDGNKCVDCGLVLVRHMEVRHTDDDHDNNDPQNLVCVCPFCHLRDHLHTTGYAGAGVIVGNTNLTQGIINATALATWYIEARVPQDTDIREIPKADAPPQLSQELRETAKLLTQYFTGRATRWAAPFGDVVSQPDAFAEVLCDLFLKAPDAYAQRNSSIKHLHILPLPEAFSVQCADWFSHFDKNRSYTTWATGFESFLKTTGMTHKEIVEECRGHLKNVTRPEVSIPTPKVTKHVEEAPALDLPNDDGVGTSDSGFSLGSQYGD